MDFSTRRGLIAYILSWFTMTLLQNALNINAELDPTNSNDCVGGLYFMSNDPMGNYVIINCIHSDGHLSFSSTLATNGTGIYAGSVPALNSANSMITGGQHLFLANAGSNTVSMFKVNPTNPTDLKFINSVDSGGLSPVALAYSSQHKMVCAGNGGSFEVKGRDSVMCFSVTPKGLIPLPNTHKNLNLALVRSERSKIADKLSDIIFTADSKYLLVSAKEAVVIAYPVTPALELGSPTWSKVGTYTYSMNLIPGPESHIAYTDPKFGMGLFSVGNEGSVLEDVQGTIPGQKLSCWLDISPSTGRLYSVDFAVNFKRNSTMNEGVVTEIKLQKNENGRGLPTPQIVGQTRLSGPLLDTRAVSLPAGEFLYILKVAPEFGVHVLELGKGGGVKLRQTLTPSLPLTEAVSGLAVFVK